MSDTAATPALSTARVLRVKLQPDLDGRAVAVFPGTVTDSWVAMDLSGDVSAFATVVGADDDAVEPTSLGFALVRTGQYPPADAVRLATLYPGGAITHVFAVPVA